MRDIHEPVRNEGEVLSLETSSSRKNESVQFGGGGRGGGEEGGGSGGVDGEVVGSNDGPREALG